MAASMYYGSYQFVPAPLMSKTVSYNVDAAGNTIYEEAAYSLTGTLVIPSGNFNTMMTARQELEDGLAVENQLFQIQWDNVPIMSGYPDVLSVSFEEGVWVDRINYTVELLEKTSATAISGIESYEEAWAFTENEELRTVNVEHSISAKGLNTAGSGTDNSLENAKTYVLTLANYSSLPSFMPAFVEGSGTLGSYEAYRTESANEADATYEVTQTFILCSGCYQHTLDSSFDVDAEGVVTVGLNGHIQGLGRGASRFANALVGWGDIKLRLLNFASGVYTRYSGPYDLNISPNSYSIAESQDLGTIDYSYTYIDSALGLPSGITEFTLDKDIEEPVGLYASHAIVNKTDGPVVQDLGTSTEGRVSITGRAVKESAYSLSDLKDYINTRIEAIAPVGYGTTYRVSGKSYSIDVTGNIVDFAIEWIFTAPTYSSYLTYLS